MISPSPLFICQLWLNNVKTMLNLYFWMMKPAKMAGFINHTFSEICHGFFFPAEVRGNTCTTTSTRRTLWNDGWPPGSVSTGETNPRLVDDWFADYTTQYLLGIMIIQERGIPEKKTSISWNDRRILWPLLSYKWNYKTYK